LIRRQDSVNASEARCHLLGELAARAAEERPPDLRQWAEIERALAGRPRLPRRRWLVLLSPVLAGLALWIAVGQTLGHGSQPCSLASDDSLSAPANRECTLASDDGTRITLGKATRGQLRALGRTGAELLLQNGHADLSVVHRPGVRWEVLAGRFKVRVTGTRFQVDWSPEQGHLGLGVSQGEVSVSGGSLRDRRVRAGETIEVDTAPGGADSADLGLSSMRAAPAPVKAAAAKINKDSAETTAGPGPAASSERKRGAPGSKPVVRNSPLVAKPAAPTPIAAPPTEPPIAVLEPAAKAWPASDAEDDAPAPGKGRLTVGANGKLADGAGGPVLAIGGVGTTFSAGSLSDHLYLDHDMLCTRGKIAELTCADEKIPTTRCNWATNWGVEIQWQPRTNGKAWGSAASSLAIEYRGKTSPYRLVAHRQGDPLEKVYCIENYRSGQTVAPSEFKLDCWNPGGASLSDFTRIDSFSLQVASRETSRRFNFCLSAVSLF
jgi:FecR protein